MPPLHAPEKNNIAVAVFTELQYTLHGWKLDFYKLLCVDGLHAMGDNLYLWEFTVKSMKFIRHI